MGTAKWIEWYQREEGPGQMSDIVSHTYPVVAALKHHAEELGQRAQSNLDTRAARRTGDANITTIHYPTTDLDSYVILEDPNDWTAAMSIELGHFAKKKNGEPVWVPGLRPLSDAVKAAVAKSKVRR